MDWLHLLVLALATWRISSLFVNEDGPWFLFERLRTRSGIYFHVSPLNKDYHVRDEYLTKIVPDRFWSQLLSCVWCFSLWCGGTVVIAYLFFPALTFYACLPFALSALAILFNLVVEKLTN